jgi:hypothetical protein
VRWRKGWGDVLLSRCVGQGLWAKVCGRDVRGWLPVRRCLAAGTALHMTDLVRNDRLLLRCRAMTSMLTA